MSAVPSWQPEAALVAQARAALEAALVRARAGALDDALFEAAGRLVALGVGPLATEALAVLAGRGELAAAASQALESDETEGELEDAALALREALQAREDAAVEVVSLDAIPAVEAGAAAAEAAFSVAVRDALAARDRAEFRLLGAALVLGIDPDRVEAGVASRLEFEALVRPELWRLCALNPLRRAAALAVTPALRARFWWWHQGCAIAPGAAAALPAVAALLASFPGARAQLEALVRADQAWAAAGAAARPAPRPVYTLRDWVEGRARGASAEAKASEALPMAAAPADERFLLDGTELQLSWSPPAGLIVDLLADRAPGEVPTLLLADGSILRAVEVEGAEERYAFTLPERAFDEARARLIVPLASGLFDLSLPPGGRREA
ncbi:MAG: hypothetical protein MUF34_04095 [Polyangiaceae bacterium]|nr:hypothetical protein [Polyangiaceae bacterium]